MITINDIKPGKTYHYRWIITDPNNDDFWVAETLHAFLARPKKIPKNAKDPHGKDWSDASVRLIPGEGDLEIVAVTGEEGCEAFDTTVLYKIVEDNNLYSLDGEEIEWMINDGAKPGPIPMGPSTPPENLKNQLPRKNDK